jgi:hypothetical protein
VTLATQPNPLVSARLRMADWYLGLGFAVFSVWPTDEAGVCRCGRPHADGKGHGKHPVPQIGFHAASTEPAAVHTMLSASVVPNIGLLVPEGCFGWDLDGEDATRIAELEKELGTLPPTMGHQTPHGRHAIYRWPDKHDPPARILGVVTRWRQTGYLIGAGSRIGDRDYRLLRGEDGEPLPIVDFPDAWVEASLIEKLANPPDGPQSAGYQIPTKVTGGHRYEAIRDYVASRYMRGNTEDEIWLGVQNLLAPTFTQPLAEPELYERFARAWDKIGERLGPPNSEPIHLVTADEQRIAQARTGIDAADLIAKNIPPLQWAVQNLIPEGTTILAAPPKIGKSCLVYQVAVEIAVGGTVLGNAVERGDVLYLALEDGERRGQSRLLTALAGRELPHGHLEVRWGARHIGKGLEEDLAVWLEDHPNGRLVCIDTLGRVRPPGSGHRNAYEVDVEDLARVQDLFRNRACALLVVHHTRKASSDDFLTSVSGTYGITGSVDTIITIKRARHEVFGVIEVTGRDIADVELSARFDNLTWTTAPDALPESSFERAEVYKVIEEQAPIFPAAIAEVLGVSRQSVQNMVTRMVERGVVTRTVGGYEPARLQLVQGGK